MVFVLGYVPGVRGEDALQEFTKIEEQWSQAEVKRDIGTLDQLLADDCDVLNSRGEQLDKKQLLQHIKDPDRIFTELHSDSIRVRIYGNVAVTTDYTTSRGVVNGKPFGGVSRFVRIFVKEQGRWRAVLAQATPLKLDSAPQK